jgi:hypothetical protein
VSDEGFTVSFVPRGSVVYEDEQGKIFLNAEMVDGTWVLYANELYVDLTTRQKLDGERKPLVFKRVLDAARFQSTKIDVDYRN